MLDWFVEPALLALFVTSFLAATLLPGGSEIHLSALLLGGQHSTLSLVILATVGNVAGSLVTYAMGYQAVRLKSPQALADTPAKRKTVALLRRWGAWALLGSSLPGIGDLFTLAAGWLRVKPVWAGCAILIGKLGRYLLLVALLQPLAA